MAFQTGTVYFTNPAGIFVTGKSTNFAVSNYGLFFDPFLECPYINKLIPISVSDPSELISVCGRSCWRNAT